MLSLLLHALTPVRLWGSVPLEAEPHVLRNTESHAFPQSLFSHSSSTLKRPSPGESRRITTSISSLSHFRASSCEPHIVPTHLKRQRAPPVCQETSRAAGGRRTAVAETQRPSGVPEGRSVRDTSFLPGLLDPPKVT